MLGDDVSRRPASASSPLGAPRGLRGCRRRARVAVAAKKRWSGAGRKEPREYRGAVAVVGVLGCVTLAVSCEMAGTGAEGLLSILPLDGMDGQATRNASSAALEEGRASLVSSKYGSAVASFSDALALAPRRYKTGMPALLGRRDAYLKTGLSDLAAEDARREWLWGRGTRWPGWYIIAYLFVRQWLDKTQNKTPQSAPLVEGVSVLVLVAAYNLVLLNVGLA